MGKPIKFLTVFGTRPEAIKMAPVILELEKRGVKENIITVTGQQREMLDQVLAIFGQTSHHDLNIMLPQQSLEHITTKVLEGIGEIISAERPDMVFVQGDTTTALAAAIASYYAKTPVGYIESGLRTNNIYEPFPEEMNRRLLSQLAKVHFAPTKQAAENLLKEGINPSAIHVTGNTVVDALKIIAKRTKRFRNPELGKIDFKAKRVILLTCHRRENLGKPMQAIFKAVKKIAAMHPDSLIIYPVHPNPQIKELAAKELKNHPNIAMIDPLDYTDLVLLLQKCYLVLTDSGGIQEEAPTFGKPVLVLRNTTERPEGIEAGVARLVGTHTNKIVSEADKLLSSKVDYERVAQKANPYGDGTAAKQIVDILLK